MGIRSTWGVVQLSGFLCTGTESYVHTSHQVAVLLDIKVRRVINPSDIHESSEKGSYEPWCMKSSHTVLIPKPLMLTVPMYNRFLYFCSVRLS